MTGIARGAAQPGRTWSRRFNHPYTARKTPPVTALPVAGSNQGSPWALFTAGFGPVYGYRGYNWETIVPASWPGPDVDLPPGIPPSGTIISISPPIAQVIAGTLDAQLAAYFTSVPAGAYITAWHEAEIYLYGTQSQIIAAHARMYGLFSQYAPQSASYGQVVSATSATAGSGGYPLGPWMSTAANGGVGLDFYGMDIGILNTTISFSATILTAVNVMVTAGVPQGGPWTIAEVSYNTTWHGSQNQWYSDGWAVAQAIGAVHYLCFFGASGPNVFWPAGNTAILPVLQDIAAVSRGDPRSPPAGAIARSGTAPFTSSAGATSLTATFGSNPAAGSKVLVTVQAPAAAVITVTDNGATGGVFTLDSCCLNASGAIPSVFVFRADGITLPGSGTYAVTVTLGASAALQVCASAYTGVKSGPPSASSAVTGSGNNPALNPVTPDDASSLFFSAFFCSSASAAEVPCAASGEFTLQQVQSAGTSNFPGAVADALVTTPASRQGGWTLPDAPNWSAVMAAYGALAVNMQIVPGAEMTWAQAPVPVPSVTVNAGLATASGWAAVNIPPAVTSAPAGLAQGSAAAPFVTGSTVSLTLTALSPVGGSGAALDATVTTAITGTAAAAGAGAVTAQSAQTGILANTAEGGTSGVTATTANTGAGSGAAFDVVTIGTGCTFAFDSTYAAHGSLSYKVASTTTAASSTARWTVSEGTQGTVWFRAYLYLTSDLAYFIRPFSAYSGSTAAAHVVLLASGLIQLVNSAGTTVATFTAAVPLGQWFRIEGYVTGDPSAGVISCTMYDSMDSVTATESHTVTSTGTAGALTQYVFGNNSGSGTGIGPFWIDDIGVSSTGYLGPSAATAAVAGAGAVTAVAVQDAGTATTAAGAGAAAGVAAQAVTAGCAGAGTAAAAGASPVTGTASGAGAGAAVAGVISGGAAPGAGLATAASAQAVTAAPAGTGLAASAITQAGAASGSGAGSALAFPVQAVTGLASGAGAVTAASAWPATSAAAGAGSAAAVAGQAAPSAAAGAGTGTGTAGQAATAQAAGAGQAVEAGTEISSASAAGAGLAVAASVQAVTGTAAGAGTVTAAAARLATAASAGAGSAAGIAAQAASSPAAGAGAATSAVTVIAAAAAAGTGAASASASQPAAATAAGAGSAAAAVTQTVTGTAAGSGTALAASAWPASSAAAGAGAAGGITAQQVTAPAAGAGAASAQVTQQVTASAAGAGAASGTVQVTGMSYGMASAAGAGAATGAVTQAVTQAAAGAGSAAGAGTQVSPAVSAGAGTAEAKGVQAAGAGAAGAAAAGAVPAVQAASTTAAGAGTAAGTAAQSAAGQGTGAGSASGTAAQPAGSTPAGSGTAAGSAVQAAGASAAGAGAVTAAGSASGQATAVAAGAGSVTAASGQDVTAAVAGAGAASATGSVAGAPATATAAGAGSVTAAGGVAATAQAAGAGQAVEAGTEIASASAAGAGAVTAAGSMTGAATGSAAGAGTAAGVATQGAAGTAAGAGLVTGYALAIVTGTATAAGTGTAGAGTVQAVTGQAAGAGNTAARPVQVIIALAAGSGAVLAVTYIVPIGDTGAVTWTARPARQRWQAGSAQQPWGITVTEFQPVSAAGLAYVNIFWTSRLFGTEIDPTGQTEGQDLLPVLMAFPVSSGNPLEPAQAVTWYTAYWLLGSNAAGWTSQCLVGPTGEGGLVQLTAGMAFDCWGQIQGVPEVPKIYAGTISAY